jgi:hypothetical protein
LFYVLLRRLYESETALIGTIALAAAPTAFYFLTGFPYSFFLALFVLYLLYLYDQDARGRIFVLPLSAFLISLTYPSAILALIVPLVFLIRQYRSGEHSLTVSSSLRDLAFHIFPFIAGPLVLSIYFYFTFDDFLLIMHFQEKYYRNWNFPLLVIYRSMVDFSAHAAENWAVIWYGLIFFLFYPYRVKPELVAYFILFFLFSPTTGSTFSIFRHYLLLFPAIMVIAAAPRPKWFKFAYMLFGLLLALLLFFPTYLRGFLI